MKQMFMKIIYYNLWHLSKNFHHLNFSNLTIFLIQGSINLNHHSNLLSILHLPKDFSFLLIKVYSHFIIISMQHLIFHKHDWKLYLMSLFLYLLIHFIKNQMLKYILFSHFNIKNPIFQLYLFFNYQYLNMGRLLNLLMLNLLFHSLCYYSYYKLWHNIFLKVIPIIRHYNFMKRRVNFIKYKEFSHL